MLTQHTRSQDSQPNKPGGVDNANWEDDTIIREKSQRVSYVDGKVGKNPGILAEEEERIWDDKSKHAMTGFSLTCPLLESTLTSKETPIFWKAAKRKTMHEIWPSVQRLTAAPGTSILYVM